jgi:general secretion pathway protein G
LNRTVRGDTVTAVKLTDRRVSLSPPGSSPLLSARKTPRGFTLIELVITITVLTILTMGVVPLLTVSVKRQKEQQLHDALRQMRTAIEEFHRDTVGMDCSGIGTGGGGAGGAGGAGTNVYIDPRSKVKITDCTIFGVDNPDRYPPSLEALVEGVNVTPRSNTTGAGVAGVNATDVGNPQLATKKKVYLRAIPINPFTGGNSIGHDWELRSCYDDPGAGSWGGENAFDVIFPPGKDSDFKPLKEDQKYSEW